LIIIPNQNLFRLANEKTTFTEAFSLADDVLYQGVKGVTDLMVRPGLINLDFADVRAVMDEMGKAMMGTGEATGEDRAIQAAEKAIANPLLDEISLRGAKGVLINITGGHDLTLFELDEAANRIREEVDPDANIIVGSTLDTVLDGGMRVSVVATGIDAVDVNSELPVPRRSMAQPLKQAEEQAAAAPAVTIAPVAATVAAAPAPAPAEPELFDRMNTQQVAASEQAEDIFENEAEAFQPELPSFIAERGQARTAQAQQADDLPPPAYQPPAFEPQAMHEPEQASYVAPKAPGLGTPSPEAMARLQAAVHRAPAQEPQYQQPAAQAPNEEAERPRFGINSLINRMTGHAQEGAPAQPARQQPSVQASQSAPAPQPVAESDPEQERIEIPAFLRRQAN